MPPEQLKPSFDHVVQKIEEHPKEAIAALRICRRSGSITWSRTATSKAASLSASVVWSLLIQLKDYACERDHSAHTTA